MLDNKIIKRVSELIKSEKEKEKKNNNEQQEVKESSVMVEREVEPKTTVYDKLPTVTVTYPEKTEIELPNYEKSDYVAKTDEELASDVTAELKDYKENAMTGIDKDFEATKVVKEQEKELQGEKNKQEEQTVSKAYEQKEKDITNDLIKRGMVDSSTNALLKEKNVNDMERALKKVADEHSNALARIDLEIADAEAKRQKAINDFNVTYALKYADRISKLKSEREKAVADAKKFNNDVEEQAFKDRIQKEKTESQLYSEALDQRQEEMLIKNKAEYEVASSYDYRIYTILRNQLAGMSKQDAYNAIRNDPTYVNNLTTTYYLQLVDEFGRDRLIDYDREYGVNLDEK